jgi:hypothetical protein
MKNVQEQAAAEQRRDHFLQKVRRALEQQFDGEQPPEPSPRLQTGNIGSTPQTVSRPSQHQQQQAQAEVVSAAGALDDVASVPSAAAAAALRSRTAGTQEHMQAVVRSLVEHELSRQSAMDVEAARSAQRRAEERLRELENRQQHSTAEMRKHNAQEAAADFTFNAAAAISADFVSSVLRDRAERVAEQRSRLLELHLTADGLPLNVHSAGMECADDLAERILDAAMASALPPQQGDETPPAAAAAAGAGVVPWPTAASSVAADGSRGLFAADSTQTTPNDPVLRSARVLVESVAPSLVAEPLSAAAAVGERFVANIVQERDRRAAYRAQLHEALLIGSSYELHELGNACADALCDELIEQACGESAAVMDGFVESMLNSEFAGSEHAVTAPAASAAVVAAAAAAAVASVPVAQAQLVR